MSNADVSELNHTTKVTLTVPCGNHDEEVVILNYPINYDKNAVLSISSNPEIPTPVMLEVVKDNTSCKVPLYTYNEVALSLDSLLSGVSTILQASVVNEKQRQALMTLLHDKFKDMQKHLLLDR